MVRFRAHQGRGTLVVVAGFCVHTENIASTAIAGRYGDDARRSGGLGLGCCDIPHALGAVALLLRVHVDVWLCGV